MSGMYKEQQKSILIEEEGNKTKIRDITGGLIFWPFMPSKLLSSYSKRDEKSLENFEQTSSMIQGVF